MKVKDLIEILKEYESDDIVYCMDYYHETFFELPYFYLRIQKEKPQFKD